MLTVGSLFAGIGGLEYGLEKTGGFKTVWQVEIDPFCRKVLEKHWPNVKRYGDIRNCHGTFSNSKCERLERNERKLERTETKSSRPDKLPYVDLICGGFPCQPFSHAGKRKGVSDSRWLWPEFYRIICEVRPKWVVVENVPGLLSIDSGRVFIGILRDLNESGYDAEWFTLRASDFGAPHRRERVFIVAHQRGEETGNPERGGQDGNELAGRHLSWDITWIEVATRFCRVDDGLPIELDGFKLSKARHRVERLKSLGNAVVPQVAEHIGRMIMDYEAKPKKEGINV